MTSVEENEWEFEILFNLTHFFFFFSFPYVVLGVQYTIWTPNPQKRMLAPTWVHITYMA